MKFYTGIGSRQTPPPILAMMSEIASTLRGADAGGGFWLRSGRGGEADWAFERAAFIYAYIFLPCPGFSNPTRRHPPFPGASVVYERPTEAAIEMAARFHPNWKACTGPTRLLHGRNSHEVLGRELDTPSHMVICWTPDGSLDGTGPGSGGTGQALRIAKAHDIKVINLQRESHRREVGRTMWRELKESRS